MSIVKATVDRATNTVTLVLALEEATDGSRPRKEGGKLYKLSQSDRGFQTIQDAATGEALKVNVFVGSDNAKAPKAPARK